MLLDLSGVVLPARMMAEGQNATVSVGHSKRALPSTPEELVKAFAVHFNSGEQERLLGLYDSKAVFVPAPGKSLSTPEGIRGAVRQWIEMRVPIQIEVRHVYQSGDFALVVSDWTLKGKTPSGEALDLAGTATDVLRRTKSGGWLYVVDNPFGGQRPAVNQTSN
jgi:ketosteroid isomerase-like protein